MDELKAQKILEEVSGVFDEHGIKFWINFGVLLGAIRQGAFIPYDNDIELNAWKHEITEQQMRSISTELCRRGFNVYYSTLTDYMSIRKDKIPVSFSIYTLEENYAVRPHEHFMVHVKLTTLNMWIGKLSYVLSELFARQRNGKLTRETFASLKHIAMFLAVSVTSILPHKLRRNIAIKLRELSIRKARDEFGVTRIPAKYYLQLAELEFYGNTYKAPAEAEAYIEFIYGPEWRTPIKGWHTYYSNISGDEPVTSSDLWDYRARALKS